MTTTQTEQWFAFRAWSDQTMYGYGTKEEAERYSEILNTNREAKKYGAYELTDEEATELNVDNRTDAINLQDELRARAEAVE